MNLKAYLKSRQEMIDRALDRHLPKENTKPATIHKAMRYSLFAGGKRLRPILCLAAAETCGGKIDNALPLACALECIHTYSLVHDDLPSMDNDDFRRGRLTCHKVFGNGIAVLAGDALLTIAFEIVSRAKPTSRYNMSILLHEIASRRRQPKTDRRSSRRLGSGRAQGKSSAASLHPRKQDRGDFDNIRAPRRNEWELRCKETQRDDKVWSHPRAGFPNHRRHSRCNANQRETRQKRRQRCRRKKGYLSRCDRFGKIARRSETAYPTGTRSFIDLRPQSRGLAFARKLSPRARLLIADFWGAHAPSRAGDGSAVANLLRCGKDRCAEASQPTGEARVLPRDDHANARFGSISSVTFDLNPASSRNDAAKAIIAALSVHSHGSALLNSNRSRWQASRNLRLNSSLQLTPPLTVTRSTSYFFAAAIVLRTRTSTIAC